MCKIWRFFELKKAYMKKCIFVSLISEAYKCDCSIPNTIVLIWIHINTIVLYTNIMKYLLYEYLFMNTVIFAFIWLHNGIVSENVQYNKHTLIHIAMCIIFIEIL